MTPLTELKARTTEVVQSRPNPAENLLARVYAGQDWILENVFRPHGVTVLYWSFAFVFFYFGFQKPSPAQSPVRTPLTEFFPLFAIPVDVGMLFIGTYEMFLGLLFLFRRWRLAFWFFIPHQLIGFFSLLAIPYVAFQPPYIPVMGYSIPWATTGYGEFVIKNLVFVAGFFLLMSVEYQRSEAAKSNADRDSRSDIVNYDDRQ